MASEDTRKTVTVGPHTWVQGSDLRWRIDDDSTPAVGHLDNALDALAETTAALGRAQQRIAELERASRTRPDYDLRCDDCGAPHNFDTSLPSAVWNQVADPADILCLLCIDARLEKAGLKCDEAEFYFVGRALSSKLYTESHGEVAALTSQLADVERVERWLAEDVTRRVYRSLSANYPLVAMWPGGIVATAPTIAALGAALREAEQATTTKEAP